MDDVAPVDDPGPVPLRARGWGVPLLLTALAAAVAAVAAVGIVALLDRDRPPETQTFVVPAGTAADLAGGETVDLMPSEVSMHVGDTIVVRNDDVEEATVGPFRVRPGETLTQTFRSPMTLVGECTLSGTGEVRIVVT